MSGASSDPRPGVPGASARPAGMRSATARDGGDVLASVRRLVASDEAAPPPEGGRLVLTPELRVAAGPADAGLPAPLPDRGAAPPAGPDDQAGPGGAPPRPAAERPAAPCGAEPPALFVAPPPAETPSAFAAGGDAAEGLPDDTAALRALIAEVVREELRGQMGERITRNLRKLVRAEIARALESRRLD